MRYDRAKGQDDFDDLGGLDEASLKFLDSQVSDLERRNVLSRWFGRHGAQCAWDAYQWACEHHV